MDLIDTAMCIPLKFCSLSKALAQISNSRKLEH